LVDPRVIVEFGIIGHGTSVRKSSVVRTWAVIIGLLAVAPSAATLAVADPVTAGAVHGVPPDPAT
jgi:hypothetical protein